MDSNGCLSDCVFFSLLRSILKLAVSLDVNRNSFKAKVTTGWKTWLMSLKVWQAPKYRAHSCQYFLLLLSITAKDRNPDTNVIFLNNTHAHNHVMGILGVNLMTASLPWSEFCQSVSRWQSERCSSSESPTRTPTSSDTSAQSETTSSPTSRSSCAPQLCNRLALQWTVTEIAALTVNWIISKTFVLSVFTAVCGRSVLLSWAESYNSAGTDHVWPLTSPLTQYRSETRARTHTHTRIITYTINNYLFFKTYISSILYPSSPSWPEA